MGRKLNPASITLEDVQGMRTREFRMYTFIQLGDIKGDTKEIKSRQEEIYKEFKDYQKWIIGLVVLILLALIGSTVFGVP